MRRIGRGVVVQAYGPEDAAPGERGGRVDRVDPASGVHVTLVRTAGAAWERVLADLMAAGIPMPVESHPGFPAPPEERWVLIAAAVNGALCWGGVASVGRSRVLPWRSIVRVLRVGRGVGADGVAAVTPVLAELGRLEAALRIDVEVSHPDADVRTRLLEGLGAAGYAVVPVPRQYSRTVLIDLRQSEEALLASFHATGRRHIRGLVKHPLRCDVVTDARFASRLQALDEETMRRTDGPLDAFDWDAMLRFSAAKPQEAVVFGVLRTDTDAADVTALVGYVLGVRHGNVIEYRRAASTRLADLRAPLLYAPTWRLMCWGRSVGAEWFDFGGIGDGSWSTGAATGGISDFKRYFRDEISEVGGELTYAPSPMASALARVATRGVGLLRSVVRRP